MKRGLCYKRERINLNLFSKNTDIFKKIKINNKNKNPEFNEYKKLLRKIQVIKLIYGISRLQFKNYIIKLKINDLNNLNKLICFLETRFDSVLYRANLCNTRKAARKQIVHKHFKINNITVNKPSYIIKHNDVISFNSIVYKKNKNFLYKKNNLRIIKEIKIEENEIFKKI
ncbi:S4 domain-containing protein [Candidatus Vidania fulgoroideorum]